MVSPRATHVGYVGCTRSVHSVRAPHANADRRHVFVPLVSAHNCSRIQRLQLFNCCIYVRTRCRLHRMMRSVGLRIQMPCLHIRGTPTSTPIHTTHCFRPHTHGVNAVFHVSFSATHRHSFTRKCLSTVLPLLSCHRCPSCQLPSQVVRWSCQARWCSPTNP